MGRLASMDVVHVVYVVLRFAGYAGLSAAGVEAIPGSATTSKLWQKTVNERQRRTSI
jgi:hypothetical protein